MEHALEQYFLHLERAGLKPASDWRLHRDPDVKPSTAKARDPVSGCLELSPGLRLLESVSGGIRSDHATLAVARVLVERSEELSGTRLLEIGCGTGVLSILAARLGARVTATDLDEDALALAANNARANQVDVDVRYGSLLDPLDSSERFRWIVANLPQKPASKEGLLPLANWGGPEGDELFQGLFGGIVPHLDPEGRALFFMHSLPHPRFLARLQEDFDLRPLRWYLRWIERGEFGSLGEVFEERSRKGLSHLHHEGDDAALVCCVWSAQPVNSS